MNKQRYIEHMLETENLTDALEDADASWLLDWGASRLDALLHSAVDRETADHRASALMAVMRKMNIIVGEYAQKDPASLAADLGVLYDLFAAAFPSAGGQPAQPDFQAIAACLSQLPPRQVLAFLATDLFPA